MKLSEFVLKCSGATIPLHVGRTVIQRQHTVHRRFTSRRHCTIYIKEKKEKRLIVIKNHSRNGTYINECFVKKRNMLLSVNDEIGLGNHLETFRLTPIETVEVD